MEGTRLHVLNAMVVQGLGGLVLIPIIVLIGLDVYADPTDTKKFMFMGTVGCFMCAVFVFSANWRVWKNITAMIRKRM